MNLATYQWEKQDICADFDTKLTQLINQAGEEYSPAFLKLCLSRGLSSLDQINIATDPTPQLFHDPTLFYDMDKALQRLTDAIESQEKILIYGDYDADGITSTLILYEALEQMGANVVPYVPNRLTDGYGPNQDVYRYFIEQQHVQLILTCDNGVAGHDAIDYANEMNVDVIVSDHHELQDTLPNAYAIIHPKHPKGNYPFKELCGAGVALKIATALLGEVPVESIELAAIGTVADMVSLTDENRTIVLSGLNLMKETQRIGLRMLIAAENQTIEQLNADTIGFVIAPRLNAIGRLGDPTPAFNLLQTFDEEEAAELLAIVQIKNNERKTIVQHIMQEVEVRIQQYDTSIPDIIIESDASWPAGVLGIVAGRLTEKYHRPAIILQYQEEHRCYKGSGRSIEQVNLFEWLTQFKHYLRHFGGHKQAAGLTVEASQYEQFKEGLQSFAAQHHELIAQLPTRHYDLSLSTDDINLDFIKEIDQLGPFGMDNAQPLFKLSNVTVSSLRMIGTDKQHVKLLATSTNSSQLEGQNSLGETIPLNIVGFNCASRFHNIQENATISVVGNLAINEWQNNQTPQMQLVDFGIEGIFWMDKRHAHQQKDVYNAHHAFFLCRSEAVATQLQSKIPATSKAMTYYNALDYDEIKDTMQHVIIFEPPVSLDDITTLFEPNGFMDRHHIDTISVVAFIKESKYMSGEPTREEFAKLYRWIQKQSDPIPIRESMPMLMSQLNLPQAKLNVMFYVFFEAKFVTINNGQATFNENHLKEKVDLLSMPSLQTYRDQMASEALFVFQPIKEIKNHFDSIRSN